MAQGKDTQVIRLLSQHDIVLLQEVRGAEAVVGRAIRRYAATHTGWSSTRVDGTSGGVVILVSNAIVAQATEVEATPLIHGRVLRLTLKRGVTDRLDLVNVHNEGLSNHDRAAILTDFRASERLRSQYNAARLLCGGDFNLDASHSEVTHVTAAGRVHTHPRTRDRLRWNNILAPLVEAAPEAETRFAPVSPPRHGDARRGDTTRQHSEGLVGSTIDLWFIDLHPLLASQMCITAAAYPYTAHRGTMSDHVPIAIHMRPRPMKARGQRPIPLGCGTPDIRPAFSVHHGDEILGLPAPHRRAAEVQAGGALGGPLCPQGHHCREGDGPLPDGAGPDAD